MKNIQESAASTCIQRINLSQIALARRFPFTLAQLNNDTSGDAVFIKKDKVNRRVKK